MKRLFIVTLFFVIPSLVRASDTFTMTIVSDVPGASGTMTRTFTLTQGDMNKMITWVQAAYQCMPQPNCTPFTLQQSATAWFNALMQGTTNNVLNAGQAKAATDAAGAIVPINPQ